MEVVEWRVQEMSKGCLRAYLESGSLCYLSIKQTRSGGSGVSFNVLHPLGCDNRNKLK